MNISNLHPIPVKPRSKPISNLWSSIRFRRAKTAKAWALIGIPSQIYPIVACRLFELKAKLIEKYEKGSFVSLLFEAPPPLAAKLALAFPAPPGCDALCVASSGDRIISGKATQSPGALRQLLDQTPVSSTS